MKKFLFPCLLILALFSSCVTSKPPEVTSKPPEKKMRKINLRNRSTINFSGICRGDITADGEWPYLKSIPISEIYIDKDFVGMTPIKKLNVAQGSHLIEIKAKGYQTSFIRLQGISSGGGTWKVKGVEASGHKKFTIKSGGGITVTLKKGDGNK